MAFLSRIAPAIARALALASGSIVVLRVETVLNYIRFNREGQHVRQAEALAYAPSDLRCGDVARRQPQQDYLMSARNRDRKAMGQAAVERAEPLRIGRGKERHRHELLERRVRA